MNLDKQMNKSRIYHTLLINVLPAKYEIFNEYEKIVLQVLPKYNGKLELRLKTDKNENDSDIPDEIHIISFKSESDFENYLNDEERKKHLYMFESSVIKAKLIKGVNLIIQ